MGLSFLPRAGVATLLPAVVVMAAGLAPLPAPPGPPGGPAARLPRPPTRQAPGDVAARRPPAAGAGGHVEPSTGWLAWSRLVARHRVIAASAGVIVLLVLAAPFLDVRFGFPDAGNNRESTSTRHAYDQIASGFGPGMNGPLLLVAELPANGAEQALHGLADVVSKVHGVAAVSPPTLNRSGDTAILTVIPADGPQDPTTEDLVSTLREDVLPDAVAGDGLTVHVGGVTA